MEHIEVALTKCYGFEAVRNTAEISPVRLAAREELQNLPNNLEGGIHSSYACVELGQSAGNERSIIQGETFACLNAFTRRIERESYRPRLPSRCARLRHYLVIEW